MRSEFLLVVTVEIAIFWDVILCALLESYFSTLQIGGDSSSVTSQRVVLFTKVSRFLLHKLTMTIQFSSLLIHDMPET